jgi:hypothetical protein
MMVELVLATLVSALPDADLHLHQRLRVGGFDRDPGNRWDRLTVRANHHRDALTADQFWTVFNADTAHTGLDYLDCTCCQGRSEPHALTAWAKLATLLSGLRGTWQLVVRFANSMPTLRCRRYSRPVPVPSLVLNT